MGFICYKALFESSIIAYSVWFVFKLVKIQDLYIDGDLSKEEYQKAKMRCQNLIDELREKEKQLEKKQEVFQLYKNGLKGLEVLKINSLKVI